MQHLWILALATVFAFSGEAWANLPTTTQPEASISGDGNAKVARRKSKRRKKKRRKRRRRTPAAAAPAEPPAPPPEPPPEETAGDSSAAAAGSSSDSADWGASDWASPSWAGGGSTSTTSNTDLMEDSSGGGGDGGDEKPAEEVKEEVKPHRSYKKGKGVAGAFLVFSPAYSGINRKFSYSPKGGTSDNLRPYEASFISMVGGELEFYPGTLLGISAIDMLGLRAGYRMALGLKSATRTDPGTEFTTTFSELKVGLAARFTFGDAMLTAGAGFGMLTFALDVPNSDPLAAQVQDLGYKYVRAGLDFRYTIGELALLAGGAYRYVLGTGELGDTIFPGSSAFGFDASGGIAYQVVSFAEVSAILQFSQFSHSLKANATYTADSATDRYLGGRAGVTLFF